MGALAVVRRHNPVVLRHEDNLRRRLRCDPSLVRAHRPTRGHLWPSRPKEREGLATNSAHAFGFDRRVGYHERPPVLLEQLAISVNDAFRRFLWW